MTFTCNIFNNLVAGTWLKHRWRHLIARMFMKPGKVLCCKFLLAVLGLDPAQNLAK